MRRISQLVLMVVLGATACHRKPASTSEFAAERQKMVQEQLKPRSINDERVLAAIAKVPRQEFVPENMRAKSYSDSALPIGHDQTISQPFIVGFMTEQLRPQPTDRVLEIGTGSGYQTAILAELVKDIYTIEIIEPLAKDASARLARLSYSNAHVKVGDGFQGWPEVAPFDAIIVTCAPDKVPQPLKDQLKEGGRMIVPVGNGMDQQLFLLEKKDGQVAERAILPVRFVRSEEHTSELQSQSNLVCRLLLEKKNAGGRRHLGNWRFHSCDGVRDGPRETGGLLIGVLCCPGELPGVQESHVDSVPVRYS